MGDNKLAVGMVNKPQFDMSIFKVGIAVSVRIRPKYSNDHTTHKHKLVYCATPLMLVLKGIASDGDIETLDVPVENVLNGNVVITLLETEEENNAKQAKTISLGGF